jgi:AcrR family transcriptional regulator
MPRKADPVRKLVDAAMALAAEDGWHALDLAAIAEKAGVTLAVARGAIADKTDILKHFMAQIDAQVLETASVFNPTSRRCAASPRTWRATLPPRWRSPGRCCGPWNG